jgi:hypothetical protein
VNSEKPTAKLSREELKEQQSARLDHMEEKALAKIRSKSKLIRRRAKQATQMERRAVTEEELDLDDKDEGLEILVSACLAFVCLLIAGFAL